MGTQLTDYVTFNDAKLAQKFEGKKIPMTTLIEAYFDGAVDFHGDLEEFLDKKDLFVTYDFTASNWKFFLTKMVPEVALHSQNQDEEIGRDHYDRGNDFFETHLGDRMVYTSAYFKTGEESLEEAQDRKMQLVCEKIRLKPGDRMLDLGCGWGTLVRFASKFFDADATGITVAPAQVAYGMERIRRDDLEDKARVIVRDYREAPAGPYDKITCLEMAEHVGIRKFLAFLEQVRDMLTDDGIFYLQIAGLRKANPKGLVKHVAGFGGDDIRDEDRVWGLFMNKYIFPGADASMPLGWVINKLEQAGFEVQSVETVGRHYSQTIKCWYDNLIENREYMVEHYGERLFRIWQVFLAWSVQIARQGSSTCFQIVAHKNLNDFDRTIFFDPQYLQEQLDLGSHKGLVDDDKDGDEKVAHKGNGAARPSA